MFGVWVFQRVPEAAAPPPSLDEALAFHGLTREKMVREVIRWVDSIRLEDPVMYRAIVFDPIPLIDRWDFIMSVGMTTDYPVRRGWNDWMAVREFIQNALDIEERMFGYEGMQVGVWVDERGLHISDRGPGITLDAFKLGGSDKGCHERGYFGEGLKVGMAHFASRAIPVYVFNRRGQVFKAFVPPGSNLVLIAIGRSRYPVVGTEAILVGLPIRSPEWGNIEFTRRIIFKEWLKDPNLEVLTVTRTMSRACAVERPNFIVARRDGMPVDFLWVRDIVVNNISKITGFTSVFGYNLWWVSLEPNRVSVSSVPELAAEVAKVYDGKSIRVLLDRLLTEDGRYIRRGTFESEAVDWTWASEQVKDAVAGWVKEKGLGWTTNEKTLAWALYLGVKPLIVPWSMREVFSKAPTLELTIFEDAQRTLQVASETIIPPERLPLRKRANLRAAEILVTSIHVSFVGIGSKAPRVVAAREVPKATGLYDADIIYIEDDVLVSWRDTAATALHEYAHYMGAQFYGKALDVSEEFERALSRVAAAAFNVALEADLRRAIQRAKAGAWGAKAYVWDEAKSMYKTHPLLPDLARLALQRAINASRPPMLPFEVAYQINEYAPLVLVFGFSPDELEAVRALMAPVPVSKFWWFKDVGAILFEYRLPFGDINLYRAAVKSDFEKAGVPTRGPDETRVTLLYDPEWDDYYVWRVEGPL